MYLLFQEYFPFNDFIIAAQYAKVIENHLSFTNEHYHNLQKHIESYFQSNSKRLRLRGVILVD